MNIYFLKIRVILYATMSLSYRLAESLFNCSWRKYHLLVVQDLDLPSDNEKGQSVLPPVNLELRQPDVLSLKWVLMSCVPDKWHRSRTSEVQIWSNAVYRPLERSVLWRDLSSIDKLLEESVLEGDPSFVDDLLSKWLNTDGVPQSNNEAVFFHHH